MSTRDLNIKKATVTRERLLKIALDEFNKNGFDKTSMRDLARAADLSLGAFYYHFKSKDEIVQVYYEGTFALFARGVERCMSETKNFETRLASAVRYRIETFQDHRELLVALSRAAVDPRSKLSPFGPAQKPIRDATVAVVARMMDDSDLKVDRALKPYLPTLLWMYMMGIVCFWVFDTSTDQQKTFRLIDQLTPLICRLMRFSRFPLTGTVIKPIIEVLKTLFETSGHEASAELGSGPKTAPFRHG